MPESIRTLVVGVADPEGPDAVLHHAVALAERLGAVLHVVHAYTPPTAAAPVETGAVMGDAAALAPGWTDPAFTGLEDRLHGELHAQVSRASSSAAPHLRVVAGSAAGAIVDVGREVGADLLLVGDTRRHGLARVFLGTTAAHVLRSAPIPALVLREPPVTGGMRLLLTTDLSELSAAACRRGIEIARALAGPAPLQVRCLHASGLVPGDIPPPDEQRLQTEGGHEVHRFLEALALEGLAVDPVLRVGVPAEEIVSEAEQWMAHLVVLGTHGRAGVSRLLLGSVAESAVRGLRCNSLVIPPVRGAGA